MPEFEFGTVMMVTLRIQRRDCRHQDICAAMPSITKLEPDQLTLLEILNDDMSMVSGDIGLYDFDSLK